MTAATGEGPAPRTAYEVAAEVTAGRLTARGHAARALQPRRLSHARDLRAFISVEPAGVLADAERADRTRTDSGTRLPLHGVLLAVKDNIDVAGLPTTGGTPALRRHRPARDAAAVRALRDAGAAVLGKANMHELAFGATSDNHAYGRVRNPWRPDRLAGGSSGGTAAAVAAGLVTAGLGTETGCSVRLPAALCGVVGFRPTPGRYPARGVLPLSWTRDTIGVLAHTVEDVCLLDAVITGTHPARPARSASPPDPRTVLRGLRFGAPRHPFRDGIAPPLCAALDARLAELAAAGATIVEDELPAGTHSHVAAAGLPIALYEASRALDGYLREHGLPLRFADVAARIASPDVARLLRPLPGGGPTEDAYEQALTVHRPALDALLHAHLADRGLDALLLPTAPVTAPRLLPGEHILLAGRPVPAFPALLRNTDPSSIVGWPAITLPAVRDEHGLPFGIDLQAPTDGDLTLLEVARACAALWGLPHRGRVAPLRYTP
ncbi:amidase family protein [Streptomyces paromomycinus]|uniref:Amidase n=1 Tax=Streptomyces paromomycinus TaxID=92743 RepID=A0A401WFB5_STREY|nr:amidase family protein [Streptomyces paromomycinus]GCD48023.1 amidase [Streptomyces paromomycinus]